MWLGGCDLKKNTHSHKQRETHKQSIINEMAQHPFSSLYCFPFTWCSHLSCHCLFQFPSSLSCSLLSLIAVLAHKLTHYSNSYSGRGKGLLLNEGRCPVSAEQLWITVVYLIRLHELLELLEAAKWKEEKDREYIDC